MRNLPNRILDALKLRAMTASELAKLLTASEAATRSALGKLTKSRCITSTHCAPSRSYRAPPRLYRLARGNGVLLGMAEPRHVPTIAARIGDLLLEHGELAVYIDRSRVARAMLHHERGYDFALQDAAQHLVGRYRRVEEEPFTASRIAEDMLDHLDELKRRQGRAAA